MRLRTIAAVLAVSAAAGAAGLAGAQAPGQVTGYLAAGQVPQVARILPPPPAEGGGRQKQDLEIFQATRQLRDSSRWRLAQADNTSTPAYLLRAFSCAAGIQLTPENAPKTAMLVARISRDSASVAQTAKTVFQRKRPYLYVDGPICIDKTESLAKSPDYPSGHTTLSWTVGMVLAEMEPERATEILTRARAYGESRIVCGVHTLSAVEAGRTAGASTVAALHGSPEFRADLEAARAELAALRASAPKPETDVCLVENTLVSKSPY